MSFRPSWGACVALAIGLGACGQAFGQPASGNLVVNSGFEELDGAGWAAPWAHRSPVFSLSADGVRGGERCLRFENTDATKYVLCSAPIALEVGKQYEFEVWVRTEGITGDDSGATICIQWWDAAGKFIGGAYPKGVKGTQTAWQRVQGLTRTIPENAAACDVTCYVRKGMTGVAYWDDVAVRRHYPPLVNGLVTDRYRNSSSGGTAVVKAGLTCQPYGLSAAGLAVELLVNDRTGNTVATIKPSVIDDTEVSFELDSSGLAEGAYELVCRARSQDGRFTGDAACPFRRSGAGEARRSYIDAHGRLIVDGEPFFPLGTYWGGVTAAHLEIYAKSAFNCVMPYGRPDRAQLDLAEKHDIKVIYSVKDYYHGTKWCPKHIESVDDERPALAETVRLVGAHPAVIAWYINDELPLSMLDRLTAHRDWMEELDPSRPTWVVLYQVGQVRSYLPTFDIIGTDPYPIPKKPASTALEYTRQTVSGAFNCRAVWMVPQIFNWAAYRKTPEEKKQCRAPTLREMRSMAWQCIAGGANGLVFYSWMDLWRMDKTTEPGGRALVREPFEERWADVALMASEIGELIPVLLSVEEPPAVSPVSCPDAVAWRVYAKDGDLFLVTVNSADAPASASFRVAVPVARAATVLGDGSCRLADGRVEISYEPLAVNVVRLSVAR